MRHIGIITKRSDPRALAATRELTLWLRQQGRAVTVDQGIAQQAEIPPELAERRPQDDIPQGQDLMVVIGGDGTFIAAARALGRREVPLLGINMGRLGFLTEVSVDTMRESLTQVLAGVFRQERRTTLCASVIRRGQEVLNHRVLNDVVIHKGELARMIEFAVAIDGQFVFSSRADGLIVATPTGSTAYALSAGGPIIHPSLNAILLVPICPHTLTNRPIAVPGDGAIELTLGPPARDQLLTLDGQTGFPLDDGDQIRIRRSEHPLTVLHAPDRNYYDILRGKLRWGEGLGT